MSQEKSEIEVEGAGSSARGLMVLGLLGGLLIGGGVAYYLMKDDTASSDDGNQEEVRQEPRIPLQAISFERLTVPIYRKIGSSRRYIGNFFINIEVLVRGDENVIAVRRSEPQLQHAFISAISSADLMQEDAPQQLDMDKTAQLLKRRGNSVLGSDIITDISVVEAMRIPN